MRPSAAAESGATHFVAMLAYDRFERRIQLPITLLSLVFAITIVAIGLCIALSSARQSVVALGGASLRRCRCDALYRHGGTRASGVHRVVARHRCASVVFGSLFAAIALLVAVRRTIPFHTVAATGLLTVAIVSHHFTAMGAVTLVPDPTLVSDGLSISPTALSFLRRSRLRHPRPIAAASMIDRRAKTTPSAESPARHRSTTCRRDFPCSMRMAASSCTTNAMPK